MCCSFLRSPRTWSCAPGNVVPPRPPRKSFFVTRTWNELLALSLMDDSLSPLKSCFSVHTLSPPRPPRIFVVKIIYLFMNLWADFSTIITIPHSPLVPSGTILPGQKGLLPPGRQKKSIVVKLQEIKYSGLLLLCR